MASLPNYLAAARPVPQQSRAPWYKNTAPTYAGIMLWFVFWQDIVSGSATPGGSLALGLGVALAALVVAALFCHFLTYLVPATLGMRTGLPLYVVGTSTYGVRGGFIMPGFLMGCLQFGWLAVNAFFSAYMICLSFNIGLNEAKEVIVPGPVHGAITVAFILLAVFVGMKGIQYVAKVGTYVPLIFVAILVILAVKTSGGLANFSPDKLSPAAPAAVAAVAAAAPSDAAAGDKAADAAAKEVDAPVLAGAVKPLTALGIFLFISTYVVGFFATAGAAGADFGMNSRNASDVQLGGLVGIVGATVLAGGLAMLIVAGAYGTENLIPADKIGELNPVKLAPLIVGEKNANIMTFFLALASFAPACFPAFIAANSFKTTMPKFGMTAVGIGTAVAIVLAVSGWAGQAVAVFVVIGASFGPICGAMMADFVLAGCKWNGPRAGFNPAGWISWAVGFFVGAIDLLVAKLGAIAWVAEKFPQFASLKLDIPCPPMAALIVGFVLYFVLAGIGLKTRTLEMPAASGK